MMAIRAGLGNPPDEDDPPPFELSAASDADADEADDDEARLTLLADEATLLAPDNVDSTVSVD